MIHHIKRGCKAILRRLGYEIHALSQPEIVDVDFKAAKTVKESQYYSQWVGPCPLFSPWLGHPDFQSIYHGVEPYTLVSPDRCYMLISLARHARHLAGDFAECGVWNGGTALLWHVCSGRRNKKLNLFDSFQGLPNLNGEKDRGSLKANTPPTLLIV